MDAVGAERVGVGPETGRRFPACPVKSVSPSPEQTGSSGHGGRYPTRGETGASGRQHRARTSGPAGSPRECTAGSTGRRTRGIHLPMTETLNQPGSFLSLVRGSMKTHSRHHDSLRSGTDGVPLATAVPRPEGLVRSKRNHKAIRGELLFTGRSPGTRTDQNQQAGCRVRT